MIIINYFTKFIVWKGEVNYSFKRMFFTKTNNLKNILAFSILHIKNTYINSK